MKTIKVLTFRLPEAIKALKKIIKKSTKYKNDPITYEIGEVILESRLIGYTEMMEPKMLTVSYTELHVTGKAPKVDGFRFIGKIEMLGETALLQAVPGEVIPETYRLNPTTVCEHCRTNRARKDVYVVYDLKKAEFMQVGRTCLRDYLGIDNPGAVVSHFGWMSEVKGLEEFGGFGRGSVIYGLHEVLSYAAFFCTTIGYSPTSEPNSTLGLCCMMLDFKNQARKDYIREYEDNKEKYDKTADEVIAWVRAHAPSDSNYVNNLMTIFIEDLVYRTSHLGLVVSAVRAHQKALGWEAEKARRDEKPSEYVGTVGERLKKISGLVMDKRVIGEGDWGDRVMVRFLINDKDELIWFTGGYSASQNSLEIGKEVVLSGTVKTHKDFKGHKQTYLSRVKVA
jgi:hypothetical protein